jgi:hypothetical protein
MANFGPEIQECFGTSQAAPQTVSCLAARDLGDHPTVGVAIKPREEGQL